MDAIDIVCNLFTEREVRLGQTGLDDTFKAQIRMPEAIRGGVPIEGYLAKMDRAGIARSLLIAVRAGDLNVRESFEIPYSRVAEVCAAHPDRFSGLACATLSRRFATMASSARISIRTGSAWRRTTPNTTPTTPNAAS